MKKTFWIVRSLASGVIRTDGCEVSEMTGFHAQYASRGNYSSSDYLSERIGTKAFASETEAKAKLLTMAEKRLKALAKEKAVVEKIIKDLVGA